VSDATGFKDRSATIFRSYNAENVSELLYSSDDPRTADPASDQAGPAVKFSIPTVANGRVFVGSANQVDVYGLFP